MLCQTIGGILQLTTLDISQVENFIVHEQLGAKRKNYVRNTQGDHILHHLEHKIATAIAHHYTCIQKYKLE